MRISGEQRTAWKTNNKNSFLLFTSNLRTRYTKEKARNCTMLENLLNLGRLTQDEFDDIVGEEK